MAISPHRLRQRQSRYGRGGQGESAENFKNEERKEASTRQKIENMRALCAQLTPAEISHYQAVAEKRIVQLEATRDFLRIWLNADMDAFYAAVEMLGNPSLKGKPKAVGGMFMISTANYEAWDAY